MKYRYVGYAFSRDQVKRLSSHFFENLNSVKATPYLDFPDNCSPDDIGSALRVIFQKQNPNFNAIYSELQPGE